MIKCLTNKTRRINKICLLVMVLGLINITFNSSISNADKDGNVCEVGINAVGNYSFAAKKVGLNNLDCPTKVGDEIHKKFSKGAKKWNVGYRHYDSGSTVDDFKGKSLGGEDNKYGDNVDILFWIGHGLKPDEHGAKDYSLAMCNRKGIHYAKQSEMYLGNRDLEWLVTFTCNFLAGGNAKVGHLCKGIHCVCGYKTGVILTANMGSVMCTKLKKGISVKEAFFATAKETQPWNDFATRKAAVFTTRSCADDRIWGYGNQAKDPKSYSESPKDYVMYEYNY